MNPAAFPWIRRWAALAALAAGPFAVRAAVFSPASYGASFSPTVNDAPALQKAIDAAHAAGGGVVAIPAGRTLMAGTIELESGVTLRLEPGARLLGSTQRSDYRDDTFILVRHAHDVAIDGTGTIDGQGLSFLGKEGPYIYARTPSDWRPRLILFEDCRRVQISDVHLENAGFYSMHLAGCDNVDVRGVSIRNSLKAPNCDGIDPDHSRDVRIADCSVTCGDDAIAVKTSAEFAKYGPCENIIVTGCVLTTHDCALKIGSETADAIRNVVFADCMVTQCGRGIGVFLRDQGDIENIVAHDIVIHSQLFYPEFWGGSEPIYVDAHPRVPDGKLGRLRGLRFSHIVAYSEGGVFLQGSPECIPQDIVLDDVTLNLAKTTAWPSRVDLRPPEELGIEQKGIVIAGIHAQDVRDITLRDCVVRWGPNPPASYGPALQFNRVSGIRVDGFSGSDAH